MQMPVGGSMNAKAETAAARHPRIRFFSVPWADAKIDGNDVLVSSSRVGGPKFLRYDYVDVPRYCLWNKAGLPAAPFEARVGP